MTLIFCGNSFKYEAEAVAKLFFPGESFDFLYEQYFADGDVCIIRRRKCKNYSFCFVTASLGGKRERRCGKLKNDAQNYEKLCEQILCRLLFLCLKELTGISPPWGMLTGIRPVAFINKLIDSGIARDEIKKNLSEDFFVSEEKLDFAFEISDMQRPFLNPAKNSFSLYISVPFCPSRCSYCSFVSHSIESAGKLVPDYVKKLCEEIAITAEIADKLGLVPDTVYIGGGTPTSLEAEQLFKIMETAAKNFNLSGVREYTVEAGRADTITEEKLLAIKSAGATRISINPQTMNDEVLKAIGRRHTFRQFLDSYALARNLGFSNINMDLIAGLPTDTLESFRTSVDKAIELNPESITVHTLTLKRSSNLFGDFEKVKDNPVGKMVSYSQKALKSAGYRPYYLYRQKNTLDNLENAGYAKKGYESLYNIFIMEEIQTILAVGAGASTKLVDLSKGDIKRVYNYKFPYEYIGRFNKLMERKQEIIDFFKGVD
jgi:oxygen-independent coproporphyrinogen-3 oxidase